MFFFYCYAAPLANTWKARSAALAIFFVKLSSGLSLPRSPGQDSGCLETSIPNGYCCDGSGASITFASVRLNESQGAGQLIFKYLRSAYPVPFFLCFHYPLIIKTALTKVNFIPRYFKNNLGVKSLPYNDIARPPKKSSKLRS